MASSQASLLLLATYVALIHTAAGQFKCPDKKYGMHEDPVQCDKFYECDEGRVTEKLCPDGLVFDPTNRKTNKCDQPFNVDCGDRLELQEPKGNHLCPRLNGYFAHPDETVCNIFYNCIAGEATEITCTTGLHFDEYSGICVWPASAKREGCKAPDNKEPIGNHLCPRRNGYFAHPDETICNVFYNCIEGQAVEIICPPGLHFDEYSGTCVWPDSAGRSNCGEADDSTMLKDGFTCPKEPQTGPGGSRQTVAHPVYAHPDDCQKFYVCLNGVTPRAQGCALGEVYNDESQRCDAPENVPGCEDWYKDNAELADQKAQKAAAANSKKNARTRRK